MSAIVLFPPLQWNIIANHITSFNWNDMLRYFLLCCDMLYKPSELIKQLMSILGNFIMLSGTGNNYIEIMAMALQRWGETKFCSKQLFQMLWIFVFRFRFHWSLFLWVLLPIDRHCLRWLLVVEQTVTLIASFMGPTWGPSGVDRTQVGPMLAPCTLLSGKPLPEVKMASPLTVLCITPLSPFLTWLNSAPPNPHICLDELS